MADFEPARHSLPKISTRECGCVISEGRGHTHVKLCAGCLAEYFSKDAKPDNLDLVGG